MSKQISILKDLNELDDWKERRLLPLEKTSILSMNPVKSSRIIPDMNLLSSFLPKEVIHFDKNVSRKMYKEVCFMSVKICGIVQYSEQCDKLGCYNPDTFLDSLEEYFDPIIHTITSLNGDIIKLSPTEMWSIWKYPYNKKSDTILRNMVHDVINCALRIQRIRDNYEIKEGTLIRVKIGISVGPLGMFKIGDDSISQCIFAGKSLFEVREAANISLPGQILLSLSNKVKLVDYFFITEEYTSFIKILGIGPNWKEKSVAINAPLIDGQFIVSSTSSEETIFNIIPSKKISDAPEKMGLDVNVLLKTLPQPVSECFILGKPLTHLSKIQAIVAMHINIDIGSGYLEDNIDFIDVLLKTLCRTCESKLYISCLRTGHGRYNSMLLKWNSVVSPMFECGTTEQIIEHLVEDYPNKKFVDGFLGIHQVSESFLSWAVRSKPVIIHDRNGFIHQTKIGALNLQAVFVFGNENQKFEINCKEALNNALGAFIAFGKLREVEKISVAVTSGMCHCGVINNSLRRAYILVSPLFKIASKLLRLYPGKIICDKKTMLHSKLRDDQFVLLEYQPMKFYEPGPVFEYIGNNRSSRMAREDNFPILGNEGNIKILINAFQKFNINFKKRREGKYVLDDEVSIVTIDGEKGQGKTKVLTEFSRRVRYKHFLLLEIKPAHKKMPYYTVRKLFEFILNFHKNTSLDEKHSKLKCMLDNLDLSEFLCSLNAIFSTNFDYPQEFQMSSKKERSIIREHVLKRLAYVCFETPYIVAIDAGDNIDKYSCNILYELIEARICFFAITATTNHHVCVEVEEVIRHKNRIGINLESMSFSHQTALVCQILNVYAISSSLQRFIHKTSDGNPGKIETILFNMLENNELILKIVKQAEMRDLDLVLPSFRLIQRSVNHDKIPISTQNLLDAYYEMKNEEQKELQNINNIPICLLASNFGANTIRTTNIENIKHSFEGLTYDQRLVLQASSILGEAFPRSMLLYVLNLKHRDKNQIDMADAIQGLFELGILCCAKYHNAEMRQFILQRCFEDISNTCNCLDSSLAEIYEPFPKYSFCQLLRFSSAYYKAVIRKLVPPVAVKELHFRALKYLHKETRRCNSCGGGLMDFVNVSSGRSLGIEVEVDTSASKCLEESLKRTFGTEDTDKNSGIISENKCDKYPAFSKYDFTRCECEIILCSVYKQMIEHYRGLEEYTEMLKSIIRSSEICLLLKKYDTAHILSQHGLKIIQGQLKNTDISNIHFTEGKFYTLIGQALLGLYRKEEAYNYFCKAMDTLGVPFPTGNLTTFLKLFTWRIKKNTNCLTTSKTNESYDQTDNSRTIANSLSGLFKIHKSERKWKKAELCAIWSLKNSIQKNTDFSQILECIANLMKMTYHHKNISFCKSLEHYGLHLCRTDLTLRRKDLIGVLKFYTICFILRFHQSKLDVALHIGNLLISISINTNTTDIILSSIPYIVIGLIVKKKISETYSLLRKLEYHAVDSKHFKGRIWYFISTLILWLETGHSIDNFDVYELFFKESINEVQKHVSGKRKLAILMWLWYVRNEHWQKSFELFKEIFEYIISGYLDTEKMGLYSLYLFEGVLLYLVQRSRNRRIFLECNLEEEVMQVCKKFETINVPNIYLPRLMHMKAYHELCKNDEKSNAAYIEKALEVSYETENLLEIGWTEHSKRGWFSNLPDFLKDAWKENCTKKFQDVSDEKIIYFTLPVPIN